jgi:hypothetical protein
MRWGMGEKRDGVFEEVFEAIRAAYDRKVERLSERDERFDSDERSAYHWLRRQREAGASDEELRAYALRAIAEIDNDEDA